MEYFVDITHDKMKGTYCVVHCLWSFGVANIQISIFQSICVVVLTPLSHCRVCDITDCVCSTCVFVSDFLNMPTTHLYVKASDMILFSIEQVW